MAQRRPLFVSAAHLILIARDQVLLMRRRNTGFADGWYSLPSGHLEGDEPVAVAMAREAREEIGLRLDPGRLRVVGVMHRRAEIERIDFFLTAEHWADEIVNAEPEKCDDLRWFPLGRLPENTVPYVARALANLRDGRWFDELGWERDPMPDPPADR